MLDRRLLVQEDLNQWYSYAVEGISPFETWFNEAYGNVTVYDPITSRTPSNSTEIDIVGELVPAYFLDAALFARTVYKGVDTVSTETKTAASNLRRSIGLDRQGTVVDSMKLWSTVVENLMASLVGGVTDLGAPVAGRYQEFL